MIETITDLKRVCDPILLALIVLERSHSCWSGVARAGPTLIAKMQGDYAMRKDFDFAMSFSPRPIDPLGHWQRQIFNGYPDSLRIG